MVKLFTQAGCGMCKSVHMMLDKNKIEYEDIIVTDNNLEEVRAQGVLGTPTLIVGDKKYVKAEILDWIKARV